MYSITRITSAIRRSPNIVKILLVQEFFEGFVPIMALYAIMFERVGGLNFQQIGTLFAIWSLAFLIFELPSGILADYWSRKKVVILGGLLRAAGFCVWLLWPSFVGYAIGFALWGAMIACSSGSVAAFLHNELKTTNQGKRYAKYFGWIMSALWTGTLFGYILASVLTLEYADALIIASIASSLLSSATLLFVKERPYKKQDTYFKTLGAGLREVRRSKVLRYACYGLFSVYMIIGVLEELLPRIYANFGLSERAISLILAAALLLTVTLLTRLESLVHFSLPKQIVAMAGGVILLLVGLTLGGIPGSAFVLIFSLIFQLFRPLFQHHVQEAAEGDERATIASIPGLFGGVVGALSYEIIGRVAERTSELTSIGIYAAVWLGLLLILAYRGTRLPLDKIKPDPTIEPAPEITPLGKA
jgi:MFS family permease